MCTEAIDNFVKETFGEDAHVRLNRQRVGGNNNEKGNAHELLFAVYKMAKYYSEAQNDEILIEGQAAGFVDDLTITKPSNNTKVSYQLKDSKRVYWNGNKGIEPYFKFQRSIDLNHSNFSEESETVLVLANHDVYTRRNADIPASISSHTRCIHFANPSSPNQLLLDDEAFRAAIAQLCVSNDIDKLGTVIQHLMGAWLAHHNNITNVVELVDLAKQHAAPDFFNDGQNVDQELERDVCLVLDSVNGLKYEVKGSILYYSCNGFEGQVKPQIGTNEFLTICDAIKNETPTDVFALLSILMRTGEDA